MQQLTHVPIAEAFLEILIKLEPRISKIQGRVEFWNSNRTGEILSSIARKAYQMGRFYEGEFWTARYSLTPNGSIVTELAYYIIRYN